MSAAIAITLGDPAGIGPEIIVKAFRDAPEATHGAFVAGDVGTMRKASQALAAPGQLAWPVLEIESVAEAATVPPGCIPVLQVIAPPSGIETGRISAEAGRVAGECVIWAARAALRGEIGAIVTAPLHKEALSAAGFPYPGHTELLQAEAAAHMGRALADMPVRMMLANDELRTVLVSIHMSLRHAIEAVRFEGVLETLRITHRALTHALGRADVPLAPRDAPARVALLRQRRARRGRAALRGGASLGSAGGVALPASVPRPARRAELRTLHRPRHGGARRALVADRRAGPRRRGDAGDRAHLRGGLGLVSASARRPARGRLVAAERPA